MWRGNEETCGAITPALKLWGELAARFETCLLGSKSQSSTGVTKPAVLLTALTERTIPREGRKMKAAIQSTLAKEEAPLTIRGLTSE